MRTLDGAAAAGLLLSLLGAVWLGALERGGPPHQDMVLPGGIPATLHLPGEPGPRGLPDPVPPGEGPPAVLLVHGFAGDRAAVSVLARRLARSGYGVLTIDVRGHGANRSPFARDVEGDGLVEDLAAAADWLRASSFVDGGRLAVAGHSMGAGAALRFAERDAGVDASVMLSGGWQLLGPYRPPNALFVWASGDPDRIRLGASRVAARLAGADEAPSGATFGDLAARDALRAVEIPGTDHTTILFSEAAAREVVAWLDASFGVERDAPPDLRAPRLRAALWLALPLPLAMLAVGLVVGALAPAWPRYEARWRGLGELALGLAFALPWVAVAPLASFVGLEVGDVLGGLLGAAGAALLAWLALQHEALLPRVEGRLAGGVLRSLAAGTLGFLGAYGLLTPFGVLLHHAGPTPGRALAGLALAGIFFPFFLAFETLLRGGGWARALAQGVLGRAVTLLLLVVAVQLGLLPRVILLLLVPLSAMFVLGEIVSVAVWARSRNRLAIAMLQALWLGWLVALLMPVRA